MITDKILELLRSHTDDLEFSQRSFIFFTSWEGTYLKGINMPVDKSYLQYIEEQEKFLTWIKNRSVAEPETNRQSVGKTRFILLLHVIGTSLVCII